MNFKFSEQLYGKTFNVDLIDFTVVLFPPFIVISVIKHNSSLNLAARILRSSFRAFTQS